MLEYPLLAAQESAVLPKRSLYDISETSSAMSRFTTASWPFAAEQRKKDAVVGEGKRGGTAKIICYDDIVKALAKQKA